MTGAIEFLRKAKAICNSRDVGCQANKDIGVCPVNKLCWDYISNVDEADLVRKVMEYQIKEVSDAERN
jgi:hypothetical protein